MSRVHCTNCGRDGHAKWQCTRPTKSGASPRAESSKPESDTLGKVASRTKSTAVRKDVQVIEVGQRPTKVGESQNIAVSPKDRDMADHTAKTEKTGSRCRALPVDTHNPSLPKGSGVESLRTKGLASPAKVRDAETANTKDAAKFDKVAYMAKYMARYRAEIKSGKRVPKRKGETT